MASQVLKLLTVISQAAVLIRGALGASVQVPLYRMTTSAQLATERWSREASHHLHSPVRVMALIPKTGSVLPMLNFFRKFNMGKTDSDSTLICSRLKLAGAPLVSLWLCAVRSMGPNKNIMLVGGKAWDCKSRTGLASCAYVAKT